jgi:small subunit ribosomal protein S11
VVGAKRKSGKRKVKKFREAPAEARVYVTATFNNTLITFTDRKGDVICWGSAGRAGFKGARKSTPFAATSTVTKVAQEARNLGVKRVEIYIKGPGSGRDVAIRALKAAGLDVTLIADVTPIPHNGPRPKKRRRV